MSEHTVDESWLEMYLFENETMIEQLEQIIIACEKENVFNQNSINEIFRIMHTIKGSSTMMGDYNIANVAHSLEDLFYCLRDEGAERVEYSVIVDFVLSGIDFIKSEIMKMRHGGSSDGNEEKLVRQIKNYLKDLLDAKNESLTHYEAVLYFQDGCEMENIRAYSVIHKLNDIALNIEYRPSDITENEMSSSIIRENGFHITFQTEIEFDVMKEWLINSSFIKDLSLQKQSVKSEKISEAKEETNNIKQIKSPVQRINETTMSGKSSSMISVSVDKLDRLLDLIGEIVIAEEMVLKNPDLEGLKLDNFKKASTQLSKITSDMQDLVMEIRMVPLEATFLKMNRIIRDMSKELKKEVELEIIGEDTEVDKKIIELISDPIMHLVRNALDHGIEENGERERKGKNPTGKITLKAKNEGSDVIIQIGDDGKGLNKEKILEKAFQQGIIKNDHTLTEKEIYNLIFFPGFSTKETISQYSGRGVGMDVVAKNIEAIGGSIYVDSKEEEGTNISLKIPLTLAIIDGMNIRVGDARYTIPTISIKETFRPNDHGIIMDPDGNEIIMVRGQCYPIKKMSELYHVTTNITEYTDGIVIMIEHDDTMVALFADELLGQQQVVVKSLPEYIKRFNCNKRKTNGLAGCTLLGDGSISLIIDVGKMILLVHGE